jgi:hypothetical protein
MSADPSLFPAATSRPVGRYMVAEKLGTSPRAPWRVLNARHRDVLGRVEWYAEWSQFVLVADDSAVWSSGCLRDLGRFMDAIKGEVPRAN